MRVREDEAMHLTRLTCGDRIWMDAGPVRIMGRHWRLQVALTCCPTSSVRFFLEKEAQGVCREHSGMGMICINKRKRIAQHEL